MRRDADVLVRRAIRQEVVVAVEIGEVRVRHARRLEREFEGATRGRRDCQQAVAVRCRDGFAVDADVLDRHAGIEAEHERPIRADDRRDKPHDEIHFEQASRIDSDDPFEVFEIRARQLRRILVGGKPTLAFDEAVRCVPVEAEHSRAANR